MSTRRSHSRRPRSPWRIAGRLSWIAAALCLPARAATWECPLLPAEHRVERDARTGLAYTFVTTHPTADTNLYFHERAWLPDESLLFFESQRPGAGGPLAYLPGTGDLVRLGRPDGPGGGCITASGHGPRLYLVRGRAILEWTIDVGGLERVPPAPAVTVAERQIATLPEGTIPLSALTENSDGRLLALALRDPEGASRILAVDRETGDMACGSTLAWPVSHLQFSWTDPHRLLFARTYQGGDRAPLEPADPPRSRLWCLDLGGSPARPLYDQRPGELVTHECWWVGGTLTFCGGHRPEESHVKLLDPGTGIARIVGAGTWWEEATPAALARRNWWHAAGDRQGRWIAADNWYGDIVLFDARTGEEFLLTSDHRTYGSGAHPHVGWSPSGRYLVFGSNRNGNPDVCLIAVPEQGRALFRPRAEE